MVITTTQLGPGGSKTRRIKVGASLAGVAVTKVELTAEDVHHPKIMEYLQDCIFTRFMPPANRTPTGTQAPGD